MNRAQKTARLLTRQSNQDSLLRTTAVLTVFEALEETGLATNVQNTTPILTMRSKIAKVVFLC